MWLKAWVGCGGATARGLAPRPPRSVSISPRSTLWCLAGEAASPLGSSKPACDAGTPLERPGPPQPRPPHPGCRSPRTASSETPQNTSPPSITGSPCTPPWSSTHHQDRTSPRDLGIASLKGPWGHLAPPPLHHLQEGEQEPLAAPFSFLLGCCPFDPQDTTYPIQTPSLRGAIPILCLNSPLSTGGHPRPTLGAWHLQTFNFRVIF